jgi:enamine deaminase RidA (YjgF/YER057c/UK114 family)
LRDVGQIGALRAIRDEYVDTSNPPASTLVEVSSLFSPDVLVEIQAVATKP